MVKARQDFELYLDKSGNPRSYKEGEPLGETIKVSVKKGEDVPSEVLNLVFNNIPDYLDLKYKNNDIVISKELKLELEKKHKIPKKLKLEPKKQEKYTKESVLEILDKKGFKALKLIGKKFNVTDRSSKRLIQEILDAQ